MRQLSKYHAEGVLDFLNEDDFFALANTQLVVAQEAKPVQPMVEREVAQPFSGNELTVYARNGLSNKSRYPRNRQTYRTGVL